MRRQRRIAGTQLIEVRHERRPELADGAIVHIVHERARRFRHPLGHLSGLREHRVGLVHADQGELRGEEKRLDTVAQSRDLIGRHDAVVGQAVENHRDTVVVRRMRRQPRDLRRLACRQVAHDARQITVTAEREDERDPIAYRRTPRRDDR